MHRLNPRRRFVLILSLVCSTIWPNNIACSRAQPYDDLNKGSNAKPEFSFDDSCRAQLDTVNMLVDSIGPSSSFKTAVRQLKVKGYEPHRGRYDFYKILNIANYSQTIRDDSRYMRSVEGVWFIYIRLKGLDENAGECLLRVEEWRFDRDLYYKKWFQDATTDLKEKIDWMFHVINYDVTAMIGHEITVIPKGRSVVVLRLASKGYDDQVEEIDNYLQKVMKQVE